MRPLTLFLGKLFGLYCILVALAMLLRGAATADTVARLLADGPLLFVLGVMTLLGGLALVLAHHRLSGGPLAVTITLIGWVILIKGLLFLALSPDAEAALFLRGLRYPDFFRAYAAVALALGLWLTYAACTGRRQSGGHGS
jgi:vacuolar-type H+-ATPase subunit I/STV1